MKAALEAGEGGSGIVSKILKSESPRLIGTTTLPSAQGAAPIADQPASSSGASDLCNVIAGNDPELLKQLESLKKENARLHDNCDSLRNQASDARLAATTIAKEKSEWRATASDSAEKLSKAEEANQRFATEVQVRAQAAKNLTAHTHHMAQQAE